MKNHLSVSDGKSGLYRKRTNGALSEILVPMQYTLPDTDVFQASVCGGGRTSGTG